jgi:hypothetical protein
MLLALDEDGQSWLAESLYVSNQQHPCRWQYWFGPLHTFASLLIFTGGE